LESKLLMLSAKDGWTQHAGRWRRKVTPSGLPYYQLAVTVPIMNANGYSGVPTPTTRDSQDLSLGAAFPASMARASPPLVTLLHMRGMPWQAISPTYCLVMG